jgi:hypothetical protein
MENILITDVESTDSVSDELHTYNQARLSGVRPSIGPSSQATSQQHPFEVHHGVEDPLKVIQKSSIRFREDAAAHEEPEPPTDPEQSSDKSHMTHKELLKRSVSAIRSSYGAAQVLHHACTTERHRIYLLAM